MMAIKYGCFLSVQLNRGNTTDDICIATTLAQIMRRAQHFKLYRTSRHMQRKTQIPCSAIGHARRKIDTERDMHVTIIDVL